MKPGYAVRKTFWVALYLFLVLSPLFVLLIGRTPAGRGFWWEFSAAIGFAGMAVMIMQFALTARFKRATAPYGIDIIYHFHRWIGIVSLFLIIVHPLVIILGYPGAVILLNPMTTPWNIKAGILSVLALSVLIGVSLVRRRFNMEYDNWRLWHVILSVVVVMAALVHIEGIGYYLVVPWKRAVWTTTGVFWLGLLFYVRAAKPYRMLKHPYRVEKLIPERGDTWTLRMVPDGREALRFRPGQFAWLTIWHSPFALKEHPFSIASSSEQTGFLEFTIKERGDFTKRIKDISIGEKVFLDAPYGSFTIDRQRRAEGYVFIAGGIGVAPIMCMLRTFRDRGVRLPLVLIYGNKVWDRVIFREELDDLKGQLNLQVVHVLERPPEGWQGETGYVTIDILRRYIPEDRTSRQYFICGPDPMMDKVEKALRVLGVPISHYHSELFNLV